MDAIASVDLDQLALCRDCRPVENRVRVGELGKYVLRRRLAQGLSVTASRVANGTGCRRLIR